MTGGALEAGNGHPSRDSVPGLRRGGIQVLISNLGANVLGLASGICMARALGSSGRGLYQYAALYWALVPGISCLSLGTLIAADARAGPSSLSWYRRSAIRFTVIGVVVAPIMWLVGPLRWPMVLVLALGAPGYMTSDLAQGRLRQRGMFDRLSWFRWIDMGGSSVLIVGLFVSGHLTVLTATVALVATTVVASGGSVSGLGLRRNAPRPHVERGTVGLVHGSTLLRVLTSWTDQLTVGILLGQAALGVYAVAGSMAAQFAVLPAAIATIGFKASQKDESDGGRRLVASLRITAWAAVGGIGITAVVGPGFFDVVFGREFRSAGYIAAPLVVSAGLAGMLMVMETYLISLQHAGLAIRGRLWSLLGLAVTVPFVVLTRSIIVAVAIPVFMNGLPCLVDGRRLQVLGALRVRDVLKPPSVGEASTFVREVGAWGRAALRGRR